MTAESADMKAVAVDLGKVVGFVAIIMMLTFVYTALVSVGALLAAKYLPNILDFLAVPYFFVSVGGYLAMMHALLDGAEMTTENTEDADQ